ncbi:CapA family protein [Clostridium baratii]|uniref:CapA family protein n=1 Tax=Clostridium baratii TaxID=1561 RepID=UPI001C2202E3|nr:CapA family protein [Clostridium baratii]
MSKKRNNINFYRKNNKKKKLHRRFVRNRIIFALILILIIGGAYYGINKHITNKKEAAKNEELLAKENEEKNTTKDEEVNKEPKDIVLTMAGDFTLGTDDTFNKSTSLPAAVSNSGNDFSYLLKNVRKVFEDDDYTLVNLETTFTDSTQKKDKGDAIQFHFKGPKSYAKILTSSSIEGVTIANNHIYDYGTQGFNDTVKTLQDNKVDITGEGHKIVTEIKGIKFGFLGYQAWDNSDKTKEKIKNDIESLKNDGVKIVIPYFHWGYEKATKPSPYQVDLAHFAIDSGADMVVGSHSHVIQSLEDYKGKLISYSLANFCFGGNSNPQDMRTFILKAKLNFIGDELSNMEYEVLPATISSVSSKNDYVPTLATGTKGANILKYMNELSPTLKGKISDKYFTLQ